MRLLPLLFVPALLAGCDRDRPGGPGNGARREAVSPVAVAPLHWRMSPADGARIREGDTLQVETGLHTVLWPAGQPPVQPPYTVRATLQKHAGRLHEGCGLVFGGSSLDAPEDRQRYSYFLVRGDGSFLIKRRVGTATPVVRAWTAHPAIRRDREDGGRPNDLVVHVGTQEVVFGINGVEVARVPASELDVRGIPGVRVAHEVQLSVAGFTVTPRAPDTGARR